MAWESAGVAGLALPVGMHRCRPGGVSRWMFGATFHVRDPASCCQLRSAAASMNVRTVGDGSPRR
jgi:hypothetical protein